MSTLGYSQYLAIKRSNDLEFVSVGPTRFDNQEWGNLLFFRTDLHEKVESIITDCLHDSEKSLSTRLIDQSRQLNEKEDVIQSLLSKNGTRFAKFCAWFCRSFKI
jgi:hypothetical protein